RRLPGLGGRTEIVGIVVSILLAAAATSAGFLAALGAAYLRTGQLSLTADKLTATLALAVGGVVTVCAYLIVLRLARPDDFSQVTRSVIARSRRTN
ncbi:MAG: hypothetical protein WA988_11155, partial [Candidatus Nanopelagicales bacterium]